MTRHRGKFNPNVDVPYELSRSRIETYVRCPACFYLQQVKGIKFPSIPGFNLNEATDVLLKRDFDRYRTLQEPHPFLVRLGYEHLVPFQHEKFELWTQSIHYGAEGRFHTVHEPTNLKVGGGLDDVWLNKKTNRVHIVDYKSTSQKSAGRSISLDGPWTGTYKRQMDFYIWVMRQMGLDTDDTGYFLYCDGDRFTDQPFLGREDGRMHFKMTLLPYCSNQEWIEPALIRIKKLLLQEECPGHNTSCEHGEFLAACSD